MDLADIYTKRSSFFFPFASRALILPRNTKDAMMEEG